MNCRLAFIIFIVSLLYLQYAESARPKTTEPSKVRSRLKAGRCIADNVTTVVLYCYVKAVSKLVVVANVGVKLLIPLDKINIQFVVSYRYGLVFRPVIDTKPQDWCAIMKGAETNPYIKLIIKTINETAASGIHECPYTDEFHINNLTLNYDGVDPSAIFPAGTYKINVYVFKGNKEVLMMEAQEEIKSPIRDTFG